jgi:hypothetical protein
VVHRGIYYFDRAESQTLGGGPWRNFSGSTEISKMPANGQIFEADEMGDKDFEKMVLFTAY